MNKVIRNTHVLHRYYCVLLCTPDSKESLYQIFISVFVFESQSLLFPDLQLATTFKDHHFLHLSQLYFNST